MAQHSAHLNTNFYFSLSQPLLLHKSFFPFVNIKFIPVKADLKGAVLKIWIKLPKTPKVTLKVTQGHLTFFPPLKSAVQGSA